MKVPIVDMNGRSSAWEVGDEGEFAKEIASRLQGTVKTAARIEPLPIISNPESCMAKNASRTTLQYEIAIFAEVVRISYVRAGRLLGRSFQSFSKPVFLVEADLFHKPHEFIVMRVFLKRGVRPRVGYLFTLEDVLLISECKSEIR